MVGHGVLRNRRVHDRGHLTDDACCATARASLLLSAGLEEWFGKRHTTDYNVSAAVLSTAVATVKPIRFAKADSKHFDQSDANSLLAYRLVNAAIRYPRVLPVAAERANFFHVFLNLKYETWTSVGLDVIEYLNTRTIEYFTLSVLEYEAIDALQYQIERMKRV